MYGQDRRDTKIRAPRLESDRLPFISALVAVTLVAATLVGWSVIKRDQERRQILDTHETVEYIAARLDAHVSTRIALGNLIREEWLKGLINDANSFAVLANTKLRQFDDIQAINWADPDGVIRWVNPMEGNEAALNLDINALELPRVTLATALHSRNIRITPPLQLAQGGQGFVGYIPIIADEKLEGFINIVFRAVPLIEKALPEDIQDTLYLSVRDGDLSIFELRNANKSEVPTASRTIEVFNRSWTITAGPTPQALKVHRSLSDEAFLIAGLLITTIVTYLTRVALMRHVRMRESQQRFADFANISSDWFWETDEDLRFSYFSSRFEDVTGVSPPELLGYTREQTGAPGSNPEAYAALLQAMRDHLPFRDFEHIRVKPDGETVYLSIGGKPSFDRNGRFQGYRGIGRDITNYRLNRDALNQALIESERANQAKSEFLATMSHEFRTPLNAILGFSEMFKAEYFGPLGSDNYRQYAIDIHNSGKHMLELINDILDISAIEARKRPLMFESVEVIEVLQDCARNFTHQLHEKGLALSLDISDQLPSLKADKRSLIQILLNLLSNAVKFTPKGGSIVLSARNHDAEMIINVDDTGIGIPHDKIDNITEPFYQSHTDPHIAQEGTGLGLSIVRLLVEAHDGHLEIDSASNRGTSVTIRLPIVGPSK